MSSTTLRAVPSNGDIEIKAPMAEASPHSFNDKTVFRRTIRGTEECRNRNSPLPQRLKSILLLVDGRAPVSRFLESLTVYGDVSELFQVLIDLSMIEPSTVPAPVAFNQAAAQLAPKAFTPIKKESANLKFDDLVPLAPNLDSAEAGFKAPSSKLAAPAQGFSSQPVPTDPLRAAFASPKPFQNNASDASFKRALNQVNDWIPDLFGGNAMEIMLELEKCADKSELVSTVAELKPMMISVLGASETTRRLTLLNDIFAGRA